LGHGGKQNRHQCPQSNYALLGGILDKQDKNIKKMALKIVINAKLPAGMNAGYEGSVNY
jgi:hypothetical protein